MKVTAFIIHLARAAKRGEHARALIERLPVPGELIDAVDAQKLTRAEIRAVYRRSLHKPRYPFVLRETEVAVFLSHRKAWQTIVDRNLDGGLIIEDDVDVDDGIFAEQMETAIRQLKPDDYIRFPRWERGERGPTVARGALSTIIRPALPGLGMQAQLVGRRAAGALLAATEVFDRPVDTTIQMQWLHQARILSARPIAIREIDFNLGGTVVQSKQIPLAERMRREVLRPYYRVRLYMHNRLRGSA